MKPEARGPSYDIDLYGDDAITEPYGHYRAIRDLGPAVWLPRNGLWAVGRFADVRAVLRDHGTFSSARGVAANAILNDGSVGSTVTSDPPEHTRLRSIVRAPISPPTLREITPWVEREAEALVERLAARGRFDAIADLARHLPVTIVSDLVGLPPEGRSNMLRWASATFDALGPMNERGQAALPHVEEMRAYCAHADTVAGLRPDGWAAAIWRAGERGEVPPGRCPVLMRDYVSPSLDTTILATGSLIYHLGCRPEQWDRVRADPALIPGAINEAVRLESPIRGFTRYVARDCALGDVALRAGERVLVLYASANRDERRWDEPERFDIGRDVPHLGFGHGLHTCVGMHLAKLEMTALLTALARRVERIEVGEPVWATNNVLHGLESLPVTVHRDGRAAEGRTDKVINRRSLLGAMLLAAAAPAGAQTQIFPRGPVTLTVTYPPGGPADVMARSLAEIMTERLGQPVVVENRAGAGGQIAGQAMLRRPPDGHALMVGDTATLALNKVLYPNFSYDPLTAMASVAPLMLMPMVLLVPKESPFNTLGDLVAAARTRTLNAASQGAGSLGHVLAEMVRGDGRLMLNHVPYQGSAPAITALLAGQVDLLFDGVGPALQHLRADRLKALAVAGPSRLPLIPDVPTTAEGGFAKVSMPLWLGVVASAAVPRSVIERLHDEVAYAVAQPRFSGRFTGLGFQPMAMSAEEFGAFLRSEAERTAAVVRENRIALE